MLVILLYYVLKPIASRLRARGALPQRLVERWDYAMGSVEQTAFSRNVIKIAFAVLVVCIFTQSGALFTLFMALVWVSLLVDLVANFVGPQIRKDRPH